MNGLRAIFVSVATVLAASPALAAPPAVEAAMPPDAATAFKQARDANKYPSFATVQPTPKDVRSFQAWRASIITIETAGAELTHMAAVEPWTLYDTEGWAETERRADIAPPQITVAASPTDTEAFAAALRARATPPPRKR